MAEKKQRISEARSRISTREAIENLRQIINDGKQFEQERKWNGS